VPLGEGETFSAITIRGLSAMLVASIGDDIEHVPARDG
jgi:hypothetical protein